MLNGRVDESKAFCAKPENTEKEYILRKPVVWEIGSRSIVHGRNENMKKGQAGKQAFSLSFLFSPFQSG